MTATGPREPLDPRRRLRVERPLTNQVFVSDHVPTTEGVSTPTRATESRSEVGQGARRADASEQVRLAMDVVDHVEEFAGELLSDLIAPTFTE